MTRKIQAEHVQLAVRSRHVLKYLPRGEIINHREAEDLFYYLEV